VAGLWITERSAELLVVLARFSISPGIDSIEGPAGPINYVMRAKNEPICACQLRDRVTQ
jgi:hypothetical protein